MISNGFSKKPIEQIDWFERYENPPSLNHQPINSDALEGAIRNPIQREEVVGRALRGSVCSLRMWLRVSTTAPLVNGWTTPNPSSIHHVDPPKRL